MPAHPSKRLCHDLLDFVSRNNADPIEMELSKIRAAEASGSGSHEASITDFECLAISALALRANDFEVFLATREMTMDKTGDRVPLCALVYKEGVLGSRFEESWHELAISSHDHLLASRQTQHWRLADHWFDMGLTQDSELLDGVSPAAHDKIVFTLRQAKQWIKSYCQAQELQQTTQHATTLPSSVHRI